jgi:hypothetical protein
MSFNDYHASQITLKRLETVFQEGYLFVLELIANSKEFFNGSTTGVELYYEFIEEPFQKRKEKESGKKELVREQTIEITKLKMAKHQILDKHKCHALIHLKRELRQCQTSQLPDDDFCHHHSKLDVMPYGRIYFDEEDEDEDGDNNEDED